MTQPQLNSPDLLVRTFESLAALRVDFQHVLWMVPRVESAVAFKRAWLAWKNQGANQTALLSPMVQTADRLSQPRAQRPWLRLKATVVEVLKQRPLKANLSGEQLWNLAQEYLDLAFRVVLIQEARQSLEDYRLAGPFAEMEAEVAVTLANLFRAELKALIPPLREDWKRQGIHTVVWFDDGEALPGFWLHTVLNVGVSAVQAQAGQAQAGDVQLERVELPRVGRPEDWQTLLARISRAGAQAGQPAVESTGAAMNSSSSSTSSSSINMSISISIAPDMTAQAQQAAWQVSAWLREDPESEIAIAVLDRVAARRLVPVLQQAGVLVDDRTGWRFSTSTVAGWFFDLLNTYAQQGGLNGLTAPLSGRPVEGFAGQDGPDGGAQWSIGRRHTLEGWAQQWLDALVQWGVHQILASDEAGKILLRLLRDLSALGSGLECDAEAFKHAWAGLAEGERFRPQDVLSPVIMMPLLSTRLRQFKRVLVLGCAQSHFKESPPGLLPPAVAQDLGFSGPSLGRSQKLSALYELLAGGGKVCISHCQMVDGKPESLLPEMQWLDILLRKNGAGNAPADLKAEFSARWLQAHAAQTHLVEAQSIEPLQLKAWPGMPLPEHLKVTSLEDWVACPLRFGLKHALPWPDHSDWGEPRFEQLRGTFVHKVLEKASLWVFEQDQSGKTLQGRRPGVDLDFWKQSLVNQAAQVYQSMSLSEQARIYPFVVFFNRLVPRIAGKLIERSIQGWVFHAAEKRVSAVLPLGDSGQVLKFSGRLDRMEKRGGEVAIADIKFKAKKTLGQLAAEPQLAPQLPAYQAMLGAHDAKLLFLGIDKNDVEWVDFAAYEGEDLSWGDALWKQLSVDMEQFFLGHESGQRGRQTSGNGHWQLNPGPACDWCEARGVCRPDFDSIPPEEDADGGAA